MLDGITPQEEKFWCAGQEGLCFSKIVGSEGSSFIQVSQNSFIEEGELSSVGCIYSVEYMWFSTCVSQKTSVEWG